MACENCGSVFHQTSDTVNCNLTPKCKLCGMSESWHKRSDRRHEFQESKMTEEQWKKCYEVAGKLAHATELVPEFQRLNSFASILACEFFEQEVTNETVDLARERIVENG